MTRVPEQPAGLTFKVSQSHCQQKTSVCAGFSRNLWVFAINSGFLVTFVLAGAAATCGSHQVTRPSRPHIDARRSPVNVRAKRVSLTRTGEIQTGMPQKLHGNHVPGLPMSCDEIDCASRKNSIYGTALPRILCQGGPDVAENASHSWLWDKLPIEQLTRRRGRADCNGFRN